MKRISAAFAVLLLSIVCAAQEKPRPTIMVVGTYHFDNPGRDLLNIHSEGVLTPEKQKEIAEVIGVLKKFKPTKVVIEAPLDSAKTRQRYVDYVAGKYTLTANEIDQIGFRLAKEMGHKQIYPVDVQFAFDFEDVQKYAEAHGQMPVVNDAFERAKTEVAKIQEHVDHSTVLETLRFMNDAEQVRTGHSFYMMLAGVGGNGEYPGAKLLGEWYQRNIMIYSNVRKIIDSPQDRIVVIYGSGHSFWLQRDVQDSGDLNLAQFNDLR